MGDNFLGATTGLLSSILVTITGWINISALFEIFIVGFVGGIAGILGKWLVQHVRAKLSKKYKWIKPAKKENAKV